MLITVVIPAFNASDTIEKTIKSVVEASLPSTWRLQVCVIDDGSDDSDHLIAVTDKFDSVHLTVHPENKGMCAARNSGILASKGDFVTILDADDEFVSNWGQIFELVLNDWPEDSNICYAACKNQDGEITASEPDYQGYLTLDDLLNERHSGEYLPIFRGDYVRGKPYINLGTKKSGGIVSYINYAIDAPIWISRNVMRVYNDSRAGSVSHGWMKPEKAAETVICYEALFKNYGKLYKTKAPLIYRTKMLRFAVYLKLAGQPKAWSTWRKGASIVVLKESVGAALLLFLGEEYGTKIVDLARKLGVVRRYG